MPSRECHESFVERILTYINKISAGEVLPVENAREGAYEPDDHRGGFCDVGGSILHHHKFSQHHQAFLREQVIEARLLVLRGEHADASHHFGVITHFSLDGLIAYEDSEEHQEADRRYGEAMKVNFPPAELSANILYDREKAETALDELFRVITDSINSTPIYEIDAYRENLARLFSPLAQIAMAIAENPLPDILRRRLRDEREKLRAEKARLAKCLTNTKKRIDQETNRLTEELAKVASKRESKLRTIADEEVAAARRLADSIVQSVSKHVQSKRPCIDSAVKNDVRQHRDSYSRTARDCAFGPQWRDSRWLSVIAGPPRPTVGSQRDWRALHTFRRKLLARYRANTRLGIEQARKIIHQRTKRSLARLDQAKIAYEEPTRKDSERWCERLTQMEGELINYHSKLKTLKKEFRSDLDKLQYEERHGWFQFDASEWLKGLATRSSIESQRQEIDAFRKAAEKRLTELKQIGQTGQDRISKASRDSEDSLKEMPQTLEKYADKKIEAAIARAWYDLRRTLPDGRAWCEDGGPLILVLIPVVIVGAFTLTAIFVGAQVWVICLATIVLVLWWFFGALPWLNAFTTLKKARSLDEGDLRSLYLTRLKNRQLDLFPANRQSRVFHRAGCLSGDRITEENLTAFASAMEALSAGYEACRHCRPDPKARR